MCGVYGFIGKPDSATVKNFRYLAFLNEVRGRDSAGFCAYTKDEITILKDARKSTSFYSDFKTMKQLIKFEEKKFAIFIGHTRAATVGKVSKENAHPFQIGKIIMTHNGHINNFTDLQTKANSKYDVDSQIIGHLLDTKGEHEAFSELTGWYTVPYIDMKIPNTLNVGVSHGAIFAYAVRGNQTYYSSSIDHLERALRGERGFKFFEGSTNTLYKFYILNKFITVSQERLKTSTIDLVIDTACSLGKAL